MGRSDSLWRRATARLLCLTLLALSIASSAHPRDDHDAENAAPIFVAHDAAAHSIGSDSEVPDQHPFHCLACHWARSFRPRAESGALAAPAHQVVSRLAIVALPIVAASIAVQPPLRSPPA